VRDGAVGVGPFEVESEGSAVRGVAQLALEAGVGLHRGVACLELVGKPGPQRDHNETGCIRQIQEEQKRLPFGVARAGQVPILPLPWRIASPIFQ